MNSVRAKTWTGDRREGIAESGRSYLKKKTTKKHLLLLRVPGEGRVVRPYQLGTVGVPVTISPG